MYKEILNLNKYNLRNIANLWMTMLETVILSTIVATNLDQFFLFATLHRTSIRVDTFLDGRIGFAITVDVGRDGDVGDDPAGRGHGLVAEGTDGYLNVSQVTFGTGVGRVLPVVAAVLVPAGVALDGQEVQLVAVGLRTV